MEKLTSQEIWDACEEARLCCPQINHHVSDYESELGFEHSYKELRQSRKMTIRYWSNPDTVGGMTLWRSAYHLELPENVLKILQDARGGPL